MNGEEQNRIKGETVAEEKGEIEESDDQERLYGKKQFQRLIKEFLYAHSFNFFFVKFFFGL